MITMIATSIFFIIIIIIMIVSITPPSPSMHIMALLKRALWVRAKVNTPATCFANKALRFQQVKSCFHYAARALPHFCCMAEQHAHGGVCAREGGAVSGRGSRIGGVCGAAHITRLAGDSTRR
jgi:hypothetical protein